MDFVKMEGLGNDFIVIDGPMSPTADQVREWCDRRRGIGADGVLVVTPLEELLVKMDYWNADGSASEMCGNGLRCVARHAFDRGWVVDRDFSVVTPLGAYPVHVRDDGSVRALLAPAPQADPAAITVAGHSLTPANMGNPHAVIMVEDTETAQVAEVGPLVENDPMFPDRTNVEFVQVEGRHSLRVRTWERGVGETLACGTGAGAAAYVARSQGLVDDEMVVRLRGGDLQLEITPAGIYMTGPANYVFGGVIE